MSQVIDSSPLERGRAAVTKHAWREAYELLKAVDAEEQLSPDDLMQYAEAAWWSGRLEDCISARERAFAGLMEAGETRRAAVVAIQVAQDYFSKLAHSMGAGWFNRAERILLQEGDCAEQGWLSMMHAMSALTMNQYDLALEAAKRTLDVGTRFANPDLQAMGLMLEGKTLIRSGKVPEGLALLDEATVAAVSGDVGPFMTGIIYCMAISATASLADYDRAGQWTEASKRWCERQSIAGFPGVCRVHRAEIMRLRGSWAEAEQEARRALHELQNFNLEFAAFGFYEVGEIRLRMGDLEEAKNAFHQAHELGREPQPGLALLQLAEGNVTGALASIKRALDEPTLDRLGRCRLLTPLVTIALAAGDLELARSSAAEAETIAEEFQSTALRACAQLARGELQLAEGNAEEAVKSCRQSWRLWREADLPYEAARARMMLGVALREVGDEDGALLELQAARGAFDKLGAVLDLRRAMDLLGEEISDALPKASVPSVRHTRTFMFTDIVGSTNLVEALGDEAWEKLLDWHDTTLRKLFQGHCGEEVKQVGDGFFVAFENPYEAVECAVAIQRRLETHRRSQGFAPQVRIGLHSVEATRRGSDYGGKGVHEAARVGALAQGGEILASMDVVDIAKGRFPVSEARPVELKGVSEPMMIASIDPGLSSLV
ncbi:MAG TPA: adenylate/guanylate cyclase domain-containing protein [Actinomycetota bacterium]|nr:adenylate/guanylate cyclase domain-containing protein [Actinomycetota bacterium]